MTAPRFAKKLLSAILPWDRQDDVLGDLEELHLRRTRRYGYLLANLTTTCAALFVALAFLLIRLREKDFDMPFISKLEFLLTLRLMRKQPVLTATAFLSLAVGIAVASVGFTVIDSMLHSRLEVEGGERFVRLSARTETGERASLTADDYRVLSESAESFDHVGAIFRQESNVQHASGQVETLVVTGLTPESFRFVRMVPQLGRELSVADVEPGATAVAMIGEKLWHRSYGGRADVLGERLRVSGVEREIVGVVPEAFEFPAGGEMWVPIATGASVDGTSKGGIDSQGATALSLFAILGPGIDREQARVEASALVNLVVNEQVGVTESVAADL